MKRNGVAIALAALLAACSATQNAPETTAFMNANWWSGHRFEYGDRYVRDGRFVRRPAADMHEVDLGGGYVVSGLAEAHHHRICDPEVAQQFVSEGILYIGVMNSRVSSPACSAQTDAAAGLDVMNALAGITARNAHPSQIGLYFLEADAVDGDWVHYVDTPSDLARVWARFEGARPDIVKIYLAYSEEHQRFRDNPDIPSWYRGLDPALAPVIVQEAHQRGLRVAAHVLSAHDFEVALSAGVDVIAHMPGFAPGPAFTPDEPPSALVAMIEQPERYLISEAQARRAARLGVAVMTTLSGIEEAPSLEPSQTQAFRALQQRVTAANIATLREAQVPLLIGSDRYDFSAIDEAEYLVREGMFSPVEALNSLSNVTPRVLFPSRNIGGLEPGAEANFVVLEGDPLQDFGAIRRVIQTFKGGVILSSRSTDVLERR